MSSILTHQIVVMKTRWEEKKKTLPKSDQLEWIDEQKAMAADLKTISLNPYDLTALALNSMTLYNLENGIRDFIWRSQVCT